MLGGSPTCSLARFTAFTASPSAAPGARLNESVTTGNWPWWLMVIGDALVSTWAKAASGIWPPLGNAVSEAEVGLPKTALDAAVVAADPPRVVGALDNALAAVD